MHISHNVKNNQKKKENLFLQKTKKNVRNIYKKGHK